VLFLHEQYHHKTESAALRMHVIERRPIYPPYDRRVYRATAGTRDQIEEGLANADSWFRLTEPAYAKWTGPTLTAAAKEYLKRSFPAAPPAYANARYLLRGSDFESEQQRLMAQVQEGLLPSRPFPSEFGIASHLNQSLFRLTQRIWTPVRRGSRSILPVHSATFPLSTARLTRLITRNGFSEVTGGGKGSHRKYRNEGGHMIVLPDSKDVSRPVLKSTADTLGVTVAELESWVRTS
jgi:predicted RNA binding protein YcfA (HicA-like mRNA interferase family)